MKVSAIISTAVLVTGLVNGFALPEPKPDLDPREWFIRFCHLPGQPCDKLKRAISTISEVLAAPQLPTDTENEPAWSARLCNVAGQPCSNAKRSAEALTEAIVKAHGLVELDPDPGDSTPTKFSPSLDARGTATISRIYAHIPQREVLQYCQEKDQSCAKIKRAAEKINEIFPENDSSNPDFFITEYDENSPKYKEALETCYKPGGACANAVLALEGLRETAKHAIDSL